MGRGGATCGPCRPGPAPGPQGPGSAGGSEGLAFGGALKTGGALARPCRFAAARGEMPGKGVTKYLLQDTFDNSSEFKIPIRIRSMCIVLHPKLFLLFMLIRSVLAYLRDHDASQSQQQARFGGPPPSPSRPFGFAPWHGGGSTSQSVVACN